MKKGIVKSDNCREVEDGERRKGGRGGEEYFEGWSHEGSEQGVGAERCSGVTRTAGEAGATTGLRSGLAGWVV